MKLDHYISHSIKNFPTLYRCDTYEASRIPVLDQIFLTIGTGLEWSPKGFLAEPKYGRKAVTYKEYKTKARLPKDYFQKTLWDADILIEKLAAAKAELGRRYFYTKKDRFDRRTINLVFEADQAFAQAFVEKYGDKDKHGGRVYLHEAESAYRNYNAMLKDPNANPITKAFYSCAKEPSPYPVGKYSPIVEMINGRTNSLHTPNFALVSIQQDWIDGAIEIVKYSIGFYEDPERCKINSYHPERSGNDSRKLYKADPVSFRSLHNNGSYSIKMGDMDIEEYLMACWEGYRQEQLGYFRAFLAKFDSCNNNTIL